MPILASAPNAIVFDSGHVTIADMVREGLALNLIEVVLITVVCYLLIAS
ncbi:hypothetical protein [Nitrosomonas sp.]